MTPAGRVVYDYDMKLAEPLRVPGGESGFDMWPAFESLGRCPTLLLHGERSDLLSAATTAEMARRMAGLEVVTVPHAGHAPTLGEPESVAAIDRLLGRVLANG